MERNVDQSFLEKPRDYLNERFKGELECRKMFREEPRP